MTGKNLKRLRLEMEKEGVDIYVMTLADYHMSEYVGDYFKEIEYISGFTGTNATLIVTADEAGLWTDGRYFIQAREQMDGSGVKLYEIGTEGVPTVEQFIESHLIEGKVLAFDGRLFPYNWYKKIEKIVDKKNADIRTDLNLLDSFFKERKPLPKEPVFILEEKYSGKSTKDKLSEVRAQMKKYGAEGYLLTSLCDIAWLLNLRGNDIPSVPVFMSYIYITQESCLLYAQAES
ncbi:MAG: aminopeptidase P family N-terminal domain-containing protein, partial [Lachnospiraceae bacterium]|nr:aminopeptidase P family N-terminal domain-containing protein [Lachnospiraceae bacterium]MDY4165842.1 aminopeptidase P family N-terminal domain-containing protein [Lachnospiraceae bacterium]